MLMLNKQKGLAAVETILVLAISALLFTVVIGTLQFRKKAAYDDSARQVMSIIARVRNQAQQGYTATPPDATQELFGKAILISNTSSNMTIKNLQQVPGGNISVYGTDEVVAMPSQLQWYINTNSAGFNLVGGAASCKGPDNAPNYNSCNMNDLSSYLTASAYYLVFRNNSAQSYILTEAQFASIANYTSANQPKLRLAFALPGSGADDKAKFDSAIAKYYANFELAIPNNQDLTVVK